MLDITPYLFIVMGISGGFVLIFWMYLSYKRKNKAD